jgi:hypothetical protein
MISRHGVVPTYVDEHENASIEWRRTFDPGLLDMSIPVPITSGQNTRSRNIRSTDRTVVVTNYGRFMAVSGSDKKHYGGESGIRNVSAIFLSASYRDAVATSAIITTVATAHYPILPDGRHLYLGRATA